MKLLRDKSFSTQILILYELYTKPHSKLTPIAEKIEQLKEHTFFKMN
jgi:hypothetical protein